MAMTDPDPAAARRQSSRFLMLYTAAAAGGAVAYVPFLTLILPLQASALAGDAALTLLAYVAFAGAISASIANIVFGWASDRTQIRRPWIAGGMLLSCAVMVAMPRATSGAMLVMLIVVWQFGLNMMLAPLTAWAGDHVPDHQKGLLGGLLAFAPALGALAGAVVTFEPLGIGDHRHLAVALLVLVLVSPALLAARPLPMPHLQAPVAAAPMVTSAQRRRGAAAVKMWLARLLVQIAEASLFAFMLLWFRSLEPGFGEDRAASIFTAVLTMAVVFTLVIGRWSDRASRPVLPLAICAALVAAGLLAMATATSLAAAVASYAFFGLASSIFLALHSSQTLRVLPSPQHRGRDLGVFNLTNTVPSLVMPWLTLALVPSYGFSALFVVLAALAGLAAILLLTMPRH
jgi:MFS family permease